MSNPEGPRPGHVLVAVDGSPASLEALRHGYRMAELLGDELVAVNTWQPFRRLVLPPTSPHPRDGAEKLLQDSVSAAFRGQRSPDVRFVTAEGDAAECLIRMSAGADLLVVGSRGHSGVVGALLGSVSSVCAAHAHCSVLVVHAPVGAATSGTGSAVDSDHQLSVTN